MGFARIDLDKWSRKEYYLHFMNEVVCTYSIHVDVDITNLGKYKLYPTMLWLLTDTVNSHAEFRTHLSAEGLGIFDAMLPSYTVFNKERKTFSTLWTPFSPNYSEFLKAYLADTAQYENATVFEPKPGKPENCFDVSMIPWASFESFHLHTQGFTHLLPIFTMGKYCEENGEYYLPLALQVHHAVCDGFHACRFVNTLQEEIDRLSFN